MAYPDVSFARWNSLLFSKQRSPGVPRSRGCILPMSPGCHQSGPGKSTANFSLVCSSRCSGLCLCTFPGRSQTFSPLPRRWPKLTSATGTRTTQKSSFWGFRSKGFPLKFFQLKAGRFKLSRPYVRNLIFLIFSLSFNYPSRCNFILQ